MKNPKLIFHLQKSAFCPFLLQIWLVSTGICSVQNGSQDHHLFLKSVSHTLSRRVAVDTQRWTCQVWSDFYSIDGLNWGWKCVWASGADSLAPGDRWSQIVWKCKRSAAVFVSLAKVVKVHFLNVLTMSMCVIGMLCNRSIQSSVWQWSGWKWIRSCHNTLQYKSLLSDLTMHLRKCNL